MIRAGVTGITVLLSELEPIEDRSISRSFARVWRYRPRCI